MAVTSSENPYAAGSEITRRRPISRKLGFEGFWLRYGKFIGLVINFVIFFIIWERVAQAGVINHFLLPPVSEIASETVALSHNNTPCAKEIHCGVIDTIRYFPQGELAKHLAFSAQNFAVGFLIAAATGIPLGLMLGASSKLDYILGPYIWAAFSTPRLALLPLISFWLGFGNASKVFLVFIGAFFVIVINTWAGVKTVEKDLIKAGQVFGANRVQIFSKIIVPYTLPFIIVGLRIGITRALVVNLVSEMLASSEGMGYVVIRATDTFNSARLFSMVLILVVVSVILVTLLERLEHWVAPWRDRTNI